MKQTTSSLKALIDIAFKNVHLGDGIGLREGQGLADFFTETACAGLRLLDEKEDWRRLSSQDLNDCFDALYHLDPRGMQFYLPAFLMLDLNKECILCLSSILTNTSTYGENKFKLLNPPQRDAVVKYLIYLTEQYDTHPIDITAIQKSLTEYWLVQPNGTEPS